MRALLLAAGLGTRLRPLTDTIPKCLAPIHDRPLLAYWLESLLGSSAIDRVLINTHYLPQAVRDFVAKSRWHDRIDIVHEPTLLGTGGTILKNRSYFGERPFFVAHADNLTDFVPQRLIDAHLVAGEHLAMTLLAFETDAPRSAGILELDERNRVIGFHEKVANPPGNLANGAVYVMQPYVLNRLAELGGAHIDLSTQLIPTLIPNILAVRHFGFFRDIGTPEALRLANNSFPPPS